MLCFKHITLGADFSLPISDIIVGQLDLGPGKDTRDKVRLRPDTHLLIRSPRYYRAFGKYCSIRKLRKFPGLFA